METKKLLAIIFSLVFVAIFGFVLSWGIINFNKVKDGMSGTELYTSEDLKNSYQDGYDTALSNKSEYEDLINGYRDTITTLNDSISSLNSQITSLKSSNKDAQNQIANLTNTKTNLENEIKVLNENKSDNEATIDSLNSQITSLNSQIESLNNTIEVNKTTINGLNSQIAGLNTQIAGLNQTITNNDKTISDLRININQLNTQIENLTNDNNANETEITLLRNQVDSLNEQIVSLSNQNNDLLNTISSLETEVSKLTAEKNNLIIENTNYYNTISSLNNQIVNLQNVNTQLENTNTLHLNTIASLNSQISNLNQQISDITYQTQNSSSTISALNAKIEELEASVLYYENYISSLESGNQVVATFEYDGSVYNIQMVNKGSTVAVSVPEDTQYIVFNGWTVDGLFIDLENYIITENTKIVADLTYKYDVVFKVDNAIYNTQIITENESPVLPTNPTKIGYEFDGWSLDGITVIPNVNSVKITSNTCYHAVFTKLHTVNFVYESTTLSSQTIRNGSYASSVSAENTTYKVFNGWKLNGSIVEVPTYKITSDTTFVADITYRYDVVYIVDGETYNTQIITANNYPNLPTNPVKEGYEFEGWSLNGVDVINTSTLQITNNTTYRAVFTKLYNVSFVYENETISNQIVKENANAKAISVDSNSHKVFNGWKVNGEIVDITKYAITEDTTFVADIIYKYDVVFMSEGLVHNSQIITKNNCAVLPSDPTKDGYHFDGWSLDGVNIVNNITTTEVLSNVTYYAVFTKKYSATFISDGSVIETQQIKEGTCATDVVINGTEYKVFNGWKVNEVIVDVSSYIINENTEFVADYTYCYDVIFLVDGSVYDSQIVAEYGFATNPINPVKENYDFIGWSIENEEIVNVNSITINSSITFVAVFDKSFGGLYDSETGEKTMYWRELINNDYLTISDTGVLSAGTNAKSMNGVLEISEDVNSVSNSTFTSCTGLTKVVMPNTITEIGTGVFSGCTGLTSVELSNSLTTIGENAFYNCSSLTTLSVPNSVISVGNGMCYGCSNLKTIDLKIQFETIPNNLFSGCSLLENYTIPSTVKTIGSYAFKNCDSLKNITIPNGTTTIMSGAFNACDAITTLNIPASVNTLGSSAFSACSNMTSVNFADNIALEVIPQYCFSNCTKLTNIKFPASVNTLMDHCLDGVIMDTFAIPKGVTTIESYDAFQNFKLKHLTFEDGAVLENLTGFFANTTLETVTIAPCVVKITSQAFWRVYTLTYVDMSKASGLRYIHCDAFYHADNLRSIYLPKTITTLDSAAMYKIFWGIDDITVYTDVKNEAATPSGWEDGWNYTGSTQPNGTMYATIKYNYTYAQYLAEIGR